MEFLIIVAVVVAGASAIVYRDELRAWFAEKIAKITGEQ